MKRPVVRVPIQVRFKTACTVIETGYGLEVLNVGTREILPSRQPYLSRVMKKPTFWFSTRSDTNQAVQSQKMARGLKFRFKREEGLYYLCSENKGADQLRGNHEADLRLCFRICKMLVFS